MESTKINPSIMEFQAPDTIIPDPYDPQSWNMYAYVRYNPINPVDPTGHRDEGPGDTIIDQGYPNDPWNDPIFSAWQNLREGSPCTACHVTHQTGRIPENSQLDPELVEYYRSLDPLAPLVHSYAFYLAGQLGTAALSVPTTANRAVDLHAAIQNPIANRMTTTGVLTTQEGYALVASSEAYLNPAQRTLLLPNEIQVMGQAGVHAEYKLLSAAASSGLTPEMIFISRGPCPACQVLLEFLNIPFVAP